MGPHGAPIEIFGPLLHQVELALLMRREVAFDTVIYLCMAK